MLRRLTGSARSYATMPSRLTKPNKAIFILTPTAKTRIREIIQERKADKQETIGIRIGTRDGGCNGLRYTFNFIETIPFGDDVLTDEDITITVEPKALLQVIGTEMDFVQSPVRSEFIFRNPNATSECGCGESFSTDTKQH